MASFPHCETHPLSRWCDCRNDKFIHLDDGAALFEESSDALIPIDPSAFCWAYVSLNFINSSVSEVHLVLEDIHVPVTGTEARSTTFGDAATKIYLGLISKGDGLRTVRELILEYMATLRPLECKYKYHLRSPVAAKRWNESPIAGEWSVMVSGLCRYCGQIDFSDDVPEPNMRAQSRTIKSQSISMPVSRETVETLAYIHTDSRIRTTTNSKDFRPIFSTVPEEIGGSPNANLVGIEI